MVESSIRPRWWMDIILTYISIRGQSDVYLKFCKQSCASMWDPWVRGFPQSDGFGSDPGLNVLQWISGERNLINDFWQRFSVQSKCPVNVPFYLGQWAAACQTGIALEGDKHIMESWGLGDRFRLSSGLKQIQSAKHIGMKQGQPHAQILVKYDVIATEPWSILKCINVGLKQLARGILRCLESQATLGFPSLRSTANLCTPLCTRIPSPDAKNQQWGCGNLLALVLHKLSRPSWNMLRKEGKITKTGVVNKGGKKHRMKEWKWT